ncbi:hypothetical protein JCM1840_001096 [Sporobolomyces johnsonii]
MSSPIKDTLSSFAERLAYPNKDEKLGHVEHDAAQGASLVEHDTSSGVWDRLHGENTIRQLQSQGNCGVGHDSGLKRKAVEHQEQIAERTRLAREGKFEPHTTHDQLLNMSDEHREIAQGSQLYATMPSPVKEAFLVYAEAFAYPNRETNLGHHEHDAAHGSSLVDLEPSTGIWGASSTFIRVRRDAGS